MYIGDMYQIFTPTLHIISVHGLFKLERSITTCSYTLNVKSTYSLMLVA